VLSSSDIAGKIHKKALNHPIHGDVGLLLQFLIKKHGHLLYVFFTGNDFSSVSSGNHWKLLEYQHQKHVFWNSESPNAMSGQFGIQLVVSIRLGISRILRRSFAVAKNCSIVYLLNGELPLSNC
jgi:hypothetical protein